MCAASKLKDMIHQKVTPLRLQETAQAAAADALAHMAERMNVAFEEGLLKCTYEGTAEDGAPLHSWSRIVFEWRLLNGQASKSYTLPQTVLYKSPRYQGLAPPVAFQEQLFLACLPTYLQKSPGRERLAFLRDAGEIRCHRIGQPSPVLKYRTVMLPEKMYKRWGADDHAFMEFVLTGRTGAANMYLCVSVQSSAQSLVQSMSKAKKRTFVEASLAQFAYKEHVLSSSDSYVDEAVAFGIMETEIRLAKREERPVELDAAADGFSTDFGNTQESKKMRRNAFLLWSKKTDQGWALRANAIALGRFRDLERQ